MPIAFALLLSTSPLVAADNEIEDYTHSGMRTYRKLESSRYVLWWRVAGSPIGLAGSAKCLNESMAKREKRVTDLQTTSLDAFIATKLEASARAGFGETVLQCKPARHGRGSAASGIAQRVAS